ncbi:MAG TPA: c-type cytochrome [Terriglobia bacterium]|nr:c-type cytochrome [Terriglobia bacterium]
MGQKNTVRAGAVPSAAFKDAPESASGMQNPYRGQAREVLAGKKLFHQYCVQCHGSNAEGRGNAPPLRSSVIQQTPDGVLYWFLKNGKLRAGMPSWSGLPPRQRWQIVSFLKSLQK